VLDPEPTAYSEEEKRRILRAYQERGSMRAIERAIGVSRNTLSRWLKKRRPRRAGSRGLEPTEDGDVLELDEAWSFFGRRSTALFNAF
jgi:transposase-like protein